MSETAPELSFDRAVYTAPSPELKAPAAAPCGFCQRPLEAQYWKWQQHIVCAGCRDSLAAKLAKSRSGGAFLTALLQGGATALGCGLAYAVFVGVTKIQFALATIGIGIVVATVIRKASGGVSGRRFQVLAVALTYVAATMGYAPGILEALNQPKSHAAATAPSSDRPATSETATPSAPDSPDDEAPTESDANQGPAKKHKPAGVFGVALGIAFLFGITLAAPFLEIADAPIGVLIILFGLLQAWKRTRGVPIVIEGPFRVASPALASAE